MHRPTTLTLSAAFVLLGSFGCGSSNEKVSSAPPAVCEAIGYHVESNAVALDRVRARIRLPSGEAAADLPVQVCGIDACVPSDTDANGVLDVPLRQSMTLPALKYGDGFDFAELAAPISEDNQDLGELVASPLPPFSEGAKFPSSGALTSGDLTLQLASNGSVEHDILTYRDDQLVFRSVPVPVAESPRALPPEFGFELAYGVAPLGTTFCPPAKLSLKNKENWPAGSEVEVFVQGLDVLEDWAPYGTWLSVAEARVSSDGRSIDTTSGGIPILSSIALRRK
ncbi:MAG TPA: hypothetical protein VJV79_02555 [Polyangiaceae bacterium]|nr:hypothetical protein [Polyangiaceae bacterium]